MKQVNNIFTATFESQKPMREYIRQEPHDENIDQEYNRDNAERRQTEDRSMKNVNNIVEAVKDNKEWINTPDRSHMTKIDQTGAT